MNDRQLRYAHAVWRERSFSKAGEKLGVSQPSLSEQIRLLEKELGFELFVRSSRGVDASSSGLAFLNEVDNFVTQFSDLRLLARELQGRPGTRVRIGIGHGLVEWLVPVVTRALCGDNRRLYPDIATGTTRRILRLLGQQRLDIAVVFQPSTLTVRQALALAPLARDEIVAVVAPGDPLAQAPALPVAGLGRRRMLISEPRMGYGGFVLSHLGQHGEVPEIAAYCDDADALKYAVLAGQDVAFLPRIAVAEELAEGTLAALPLDPPLTLDIQVARRLDVFPERLERALAQLAAALAAAWPGEKL